MKSKKDSVDGKQIKKRKIIKKQPPNPPSLIFEVETILDERKNAKNEIEYLVKWKNYPPEENSWEPEYGLRRCQILLNEYMKSKEKSKPKLDPAKKVKLLVKKNGEKFSCLKKKEGLLESKPISNKYKNSKINYELIPEEYLSRLCQVKKRTHKKIVYCRGTSIYKKKTYIINIP